MAETPNHISGRDVGCGFIGAIFGTNRRKTPPLPQLEASKNHRRGTTATAAAGIVYAGFSKTPPPKNKPIKPVSDSLPKNSFNGVSQITNAAYAGRLRKEPSFTSSELSVRASSGNVMVPGHLGNLMKKPGTAKTHRKTGNNSGGLIPARKSDPEAFKNRGNEKYKQGRFEEAIALYTEAIGMNPKTASYYSNRSAALIGLGKLIDAVLDCRVAIRIEPSYHRAHYRLAALYLRFGEVEKALCHYKCSGAKAERKDIAKAEALKAQIDKCYEARKIKDWKRLSKESQITISLGADSSPRVYAMQVEALLNLHRHQEAYSCFENAPKIDVNISVQLFGSTITANFLTIQAQVYLASGRFEEAMSVVLRASELDSSEEVLAEARKTRAVAKARACGNKIFKASRFSEACNVYSEGLEHEPYNSVLLCNRAACRFKLSRFEKAVEDCTVALNLRPSYAKARLRRAQCYAKLERWEAAIEDYEVLNQETPDDDEVERALLEARVQLNKRHTENATMRLVNGCDTNDFGGFLIAHGEDQKMGVA